MRILAESPNFTLAHEAEEVYVVHRESGRKTWAGDHYGDPTCGVIAPDESWFASGGEGIVLFTFRRGMREYFRPGSCIHDYLDLASKEKKRIDLSLMPAEAGVFAIHAMRLEPNGDLRFLVSPWSELPSVWILAPATGALTKVQDGPDLRDQEYREDVPY
jgi:hypothetical protein